MLVGLAVCLLELRTARFVSFDTWAVKVSDIYGSLWK